MKRLTDYRYSRTAFPALLATSALLAVGCASLPAPTEQIAVSRAAVSSAVSDGGNEYAPLLLKSAVDKMAGAERAMTDKDYLHARRLAEQAQLDAKLAETTADYGKAQKAVDSAQESNRVLREEIGRTAK